MSEKKKEYDNGELSVVWKPHICIHSGNCVKGLPGVFKPKEKPWIKIDEASTEELMETIDRCPSGALSYYNTAEGPESQKANETDRVQVKLIPNGPVELRGALRIQTPDGDFRDRDKSTFLCRCGASENKPYCDGSHNKVEFKA
jgi:uncharacterized Fe-S cluster protein YjdI